MQFPWMMYRRGPGLALPRGQSVSCQVALDEAEYAAAIAAGWSPSVPEAISEGPAVGKFEAPAPPEGVIPPKREIPTEKVKLPSFQPEVSDVSIRHGPGRPRKA